MKIFIYLLLLAAISIAPFSFAQEKEEESFRKGFVIGIGLGHGLANISYDAKYNYSGNNYFNYSGYILRLGYVTNFKIGYALSSTTIIHWATKANWFIDSRSTSTGSKTVTMVNGFGGPSITYYLEPKAPSFFLNGGIGYSNLFEFSTSGNAKNSFGFGFCTGVGYEFAKYWNLELNYYWGTSKIKTEEYKGYEENTIPFTIVLTINFLWH